MTTATAPAAFAAPGSTGTFHRLWRIVRLHLANPSIFIGIPWAIVGLASLVTITIAIIMRSAGATPDDLENMRYSWAVVSPQWYMVVVGVQAIGLTFQFALGFGTTRRDFWLGTSLIFVLVSAANAVAIALLVQLEKATGGWWVGAHMFNSLWYGLDGFAVDLFSTFSLQLFVLVVGASVTTVYMRWRMPGMLALIAGFAVLLLAVIAYFTFSGNWDAVFGWLGSIGIAGAFGLLLGLSIVLLAAGYLVIRRATPRS